MNLFNKIALSTILTLTLTSQSSAANLPNKPPVQGLVNMGDITFYNKQDSIDPPSPNNSLDKLTLSNTVQLFGGTVINVTWAQLQPNSPDEHGNITLDTTSIDQALSVINAYNQANPNAKITAKLRVWAGFAAPNWVKNLNGNEPINIVAQKGNVTQKGTVAHWWEEDYLDNWANFLSALANATDINGYTYDEEPLIREISVTSCASSTDEPFISWADPNAEHALISAGYTDIAQQNCLSNAINLHYAAWKNTWLDFPISPFFPMQGGSSQPNFTFSYSVMQQCAEHGACVISNQGLNQASSMNSNLAQIYQKILSFVANGTVYADFQTVSPAVLAKSENDNLCYVFKTGAQYYAQSIELWPSVANLNGFDTLSRTQIQILAAILQGNMSESCDDFQSIKK
ncbi:hypothetical protein Lsan_4068 [Legionella santicrucis]|uniref:Uncharacterized protein n=1 Tax=Legionella santicrucis TaxID=45074 RepID=A0A0W0Y9W7_9GAMM|nr:hypothetical protein [Legionella santicrucis]KTD53658.1 hypothetical protein Lsan_4068 [Legionella santicrucis]